jgi:hypothetical protein
MPPAQVQICLREVPPPALEVMDGLEVMCNKLLKIRGGAGCHFLACRRFDVSFTQWEELPGQGILWIEESLLGQLFAIGAGKRWREVEFVRCHASTPASCKGSLMGACVAAASLVEKRRVASC